MIFPSPRKFSTSVFLSDFLSDISIQIFIQVPFQADDIFFLLALLGQAVFKAPHWSAGVYDKVKEFRKDMFLWFLPNLAKMIFRSNLTKVILWSFAFQWYEPVKSQLKLAKL